MSVFQFLDRNFIQANIFSEHDILTSIPVLPIADDSGLRSIDYQVQTVADVTLIRFGKGIGLRLADITGQHPPDSIDYTIGRTLLDLAGSLYTDLVRESGRAAWTFRRQLEFQQKYSVLVYLIDLHFTHNRLLQVCPQLETIRRLHAHPQPEQATRTAPVPNPSTNIPPQPVQEPPVIIFTEPRESFSSDSTRVNTPEPLSTEPEFISVDRNSNSIENNSSSSL